jgi:hypothetical protein
MNSNRIEINKSIVNNFNKDNKNNNSKSKVHFSTTRKVRNIPRINRSGFIVPNTVPKRMGNFSSKTRRKLNMKNLFVNTSDTSNKLITMKNTYKNLNTRQKQNFARFIGKIIKKRESLPEVIEYVRNHKEYPAVLKKLAIDYLLQRYPVYNVNYPRTENGEINNLYEGGMYPI